MQKNSLVVSIVQIYGLNITYQEFAAIQFKQTVHQLLATAETKSKAYWDINKYMAHFCCYCFVSALIV